MAFEDFLSVQPFGQSMSAGKRSVGPRSAKFRVSARRLGGKHTPEGRAMLMKGEELRLMEPNISTPESRDLINKGEQIKAAYASGGLKFSKDLKPLRRQWFQDVQTSSLSAEDKDGIRQMFTKDFLDGGKELDAEAQRDFNIKNQKFGIQKAKQDIQRNQQILQLGESTLIDAEDAQTKKGVQLDNEGKTSNFVGKKLTEISNTQEKSSDLSQEEKDVKDIQIKQKIENDATRFLAKYPELSEGSRLAIQNLLQTVGSDIRVVQQRQDRAEAARQSITNMMVNQGGSIGFVPDLKLKGVAGLTTNLDNFAAAQKIRIDNLRTERDRAVRQDAIDEVSSSYMGSLSDLPKELGQVPRTAEVAEANLKSYIARLKSFAEFAPSEELKRITEDIQGVESTINEEEWKGINDTVKSAEFLLIVSTIKGVMRDINSSIYKPITQIGLTEDQIKSQQEALSKFKSKG